MEKLRLEDDRWCFACGEKNPHGLKLEFELGEDDALHTSLTFRKEHQGYAGIVHGGLVGLVLDEIMLNLAWRVGLKAVTAQFEMRLKKAVRVGENIRFKGWLSSKGRRLLSAAAEARDGEGNLVATATAKCIVMP